MIILFLVQYLLSLLQYTHCLLIPVFTYEFAVFDITIMTEILQYQPFKKTLKFVIIFPFNLLQYLLSLLQYTHCLLIPVFTYEFTVFDITILTEILQYQLVKNVKKRKERKERHTTPARIRNQR